MALFVLLYQWFPITLHRLLGKRKKYRYNVSICLIFKNEALFLQEWIEYHLLIGVEHFYLYNNNSDDNYRSVLEPYIKSNIVTLIDWPKQHAQVEAYKDCYDRFSNETHWLAYIDADEFINLQQDDNILKLISRYKNYPALYLNWRDFGTSGILEQPENTLVTETYVAAWPWLCHVGKTIINNDYKFHHMTPHYFNAKYFGFRLYPVNDLKLPVPYMPTLWSFGIGRKAYINHYFSKSYNWYIYKDFKRGDVLSSKNVELKKRKGRFEIHELNNYVRDFSIQRWTTFLKLAIDKRNKGV